MQSSLTINHLENLEATLKLTLTVADWKLLANQIKNASLVSCYPISEVFWSVQSMVSQLEKTYWPEVE